MKTVFNGLETMSAPKVSIDRFGDDSFNPKVTFGNLDINNQGDMLAWSGLGTFLNNRWQLSRSCSAADATNRSCFKPLMVAGTYTLMDYPGIFTSSDPDHCPGDNGGLFIWAYTLVYNPMPLPISVMQADVDITWVGDKTINASLIPPCVAFLGPDACPNPIGGTCAHLCTDAMQLARVIAPIGGKKGVPVVKIPAGGAAIWKAKTCVTASLSVLSPWMTTGGYLNSRHYPDMDPAATTWAFPANLTGSRPFPLVTDLKGVVTAGVGDDPATGFELTVEVSQSNVPGTVPFMCTPGHASAEDGCSF
jgi:hypothetical protein